MQKGPVWFQNSLRKIFDMEQSVATISDQREYIFLLTAIVSLIVVLSICASRVEL